MNETIKKAALGGLIPVIKIKDPMRAVPVCEALRKGGIACAEVTFRTDGAEEAIKNISEGLPGMLVGAGTVTSIEQADKAMRAGAKFIVSPGLNPEVVAHCHKLGLPIVPGVSTPSEIERAMGMGLNVLKFFPAEASGGVNAIKAMAAPYSGIKFIPTGGINEKNIMDYLNMPAVLACGGSWIVEEKLIDAGEYEKIAALTRSAVKAIMGFELTHVGINAQDDEQARQIAGLFGAAFSLEYRPGSRSDFSGDLFEIMKGPGRGAHGHIAIGVNWIERAIPYMESQGYALDYASAYINESGVRAAIYLEKEFAGFAVHLVQKKR